MLDDLKLGRQKRADGAREPARYTESVVRYTYFTYFRGRDIRGVFHVFSLRPAGPWRGELRSAPPAHDASIRERSLSHLSNSDTIPLIFRSKMFELTELKTFQCLERAV